MDKKNTNLSNEENELLELLNDSYSGEKKKETIDILADVIFQVTSKSLKNSKFLYPDEFQASNIHYFAIIRLGDYYPDVDELVKLNEAFDLAKKLDLNEPAVKYFEPLFNASLNYLRDSSYLGVRCSKVESKGGLFNKFKIPGITYPEFEFEVFDFPQVTKDIIDAIKDLTKDEHFDIQMAYSINFGKKSDMNYSPIVVTANQELSAYGPSINFLYLGSVFKDTDRTICSPVDKKINMSFKGSASDLNYSGFSFTPCLQITIKK